MNFELNGDTLKESKTRPSQMRALVKTQNFLSDKVVSQGGNWVKQKTKLIHCGHNISRMIAPFTFLTFQAVFDFAKTAKMFNLLLADQTIVFFGNCYREKKTYQRLPLQNKKCQQAPTLVSHYLLARCKEVK